MPFRAHHSTSHTTPLKGAHGVGCACGRARTGSETGTQVRNCRVPPVARRQFLEAAAGQYFFFPSAAAAQLQSRHSSATVLALFVLVKQVN
jgi:hypothetical protein